MSLPWTPMTLPRTSPIMLPLLTPRPPHWMASLLPRMLPSPLVLRSGPSRARNCRCCRNSLGALEQIDT